MSGIIPAISLRAASDTDREFLTAVYAATRMNELEVTDWTDSQKHEFCRMQFAAQDSHYRQHYPTAQYQVIEMDATPVGRLYVDRWKHEIRIMDIAILPAYRGIGIGSTLLLDLKREAAASDRSLSIHVERLNPALRLYDRQGFKMIEDKGVYLLMEWRHAASIR